MAVSQRSAQIIQFPDQNDLATHSFRREAIKEELNRIHFNKLQSTAGIEVLGVDNPKTAITTPFFADKRSSTETCYARLSTNLPTEAVPGIHEIKVVGAGELDFFMFELHEPQAKKRVLNPRELKKISDKRLAAVEAFAQMDFNRLDPFKLNEIIRHSSESNEPFQSAQYLRWRIATRGEDPLHPPKFPTLEIFFRDEQTYVVFDQYPLPPTQRTYVTDTISTFGGSKGESLIASITKAFVGGTPEHVQLALDIGSEFKPVTAEQISNIPQIDL